MGIAHSNSKSVLNILRTARLFVAAAPFYIPIKKVQRFHLNFSATLSIWYVRMFHQRDHYAHCTRWYISISYIFKCFTNKIGIMKMVSLLSLDAEQCVPCPDRVSKQGEQSLPPRAVTFLAFEGSLGCHWPAQLCACVLSWLWFCGSSCGSTRHIHSQGR